jgi:hypothetical protein
MAAPVRSANMVRRDSLLTRRKALQAEIDVRTAQVAKIDASVSEVSEKIVHEATVARATVVPRDAAADLIPGVNRPG